MTLRELRAKLAEKWAALQALVKNPDGSDKLEMTADEQAAFDRLDAEVNTLSLQVDAAEARLQRIAQHGVRMSAPIDAAGLASGEAFRLTDGRLVQAHRSGERLGAPVAMAGRRDLDGDEGEFGLAEALAARMFGYVSQRHARHVEMMQENTGPNGGFLVPGGLSNQIIDLARDRSILSQAGMQTLDLTGVNVPMGSFSIATVTGDPEPGWRGEGMSIPQSDATFGLLNIVPRSLAVIVPITLELLMDAPNVEQLLRGVLGEKFGLALDQAGLNGAGFGPEPTGLLNNGRIYHLAPAGGPTQVISHDEVIKGFFGVRAANAPGPISTIMRPEVAMGLETKVGSDGQYLIPPPSWSELNRFQSNSLPQAQATGASPLIVGDFSGFLLVIRQRLFIDVGLAAGQFETGKASFRAMLRADYALIRSKWFYVRDGIVPA